jgi:hypothetical protein
VNLFDRDYKRNENKNFTVSSTIHQPMCLRAAKEEVKLSQDSYSSEMRHEKGIFLL